MTPCICIAFPPESYLRKLIVSFSGGCVLLSQRLYDAVSHLDDGVVVRGVTEERYFREVVSSSSSSRKLRDIFFLSLYLVFAFICRSTLVIFLDAVREMGPRQWEYLKAYSRYKKPDA